MCGLDECLVAGDPNPFTGAELHSDRGCGVGEVCGLGACPRFCPDGQPHCCRPNRCIQEIHDPCGDGPALCQAEPPVCPAGLVPEAENGCWGDCVDPVSCLPPPEPV